MLLNSELSALEHCAVFLYPPLQTFGSTETLSTVQKCVRHHFNIEEFRRIRVLFVKLVHHLLKGFKGRCLWK